MAATVTVNDVLDGHVGLDVECLDRIYLNGYVPNLQVGGQVVSFMTAHLGLPIPSPAILDKIGTAFRRSVQSSATDNNIPVVRFQGRPQDRCDAAVSGSPGGYRPVGSGGDRGGSGVPECVRHGQTYGQQRGPVVFVFQVGPTGIVLLLLPVGQRLRPGIHQGLHVFPVSGQGVA
jgi:hypothetical protein